MKEYKILKPQKTNAKRIFVPKGHAVPEDILDDITVNPETSTLWEEKCGDDIINSDQIPTHWTGEWNYNISELSNVQGHISLEPVYTYDFICDVILPGRYEIGDFSRVIKDVQPEKIQNTKLFSILSDYMDNEFDRPHIHREIILNSGTALSDIVFTELSAISGKEYAFGSSMLFLSDKLWVPGNFSNVTLSAYIESGYSYDEYENVERQISSAIDMTKPENLDIILSAYPTYRMNITPKYQDFYTLTLRVDLPADSYLVYFHTLGPVYYYGQGRYSYNILVKPGNDALCNTLMFCDGNFIDAQALEVFNNEPYYMYVTGTSLSNLVVYYAGSSIKIQSQNHSDEIADIDDSIAGLLDMNITESKNIRFYADPIGNSVNFSRILLDNFTGNIADIDINSRQYSGTIICASFGDAYNPDSQSYDQIPFGDNMHFTNHDVFTEMLNDCDFNPLWDNAPDENYDPNAYSLVGIVNVDNPIAILDTDTNIGNGVEGGFDMYTPANVCLIYAKNQ